MRTLNFQHVGRQMSESFLTAAVQSICGGLQDVYFYVSRGEVFANAQTGNIVLFSQNVFACNWELTIRYMVPVLFFAFGVAVATWIRQSFQNAQRLHWRQIILLIEIVLLFLVGFMPEEQNLIANALVSFSCAMQVQTFRKVNGHSYASTMCIGNLRSGTAALSVYLREKKPEQLEMSLYYFGVILFFAVGAGIGGVLSVHLGFHAIWVSSGLLLISFLLMFKDRLEKDVHELEGDLEEDIQKLGTQLREEIKK